MWQFLLGLVVGGIAGIFIMSLANMSASSTDRAYTYRLYNSLNTLYIACFLADVHGDLSEHVSGDVLENASAVLEDFRREH